MFNVKQRFNRVLKAISLSTILCFLTTEIAWANPQGSISLLRSSETPVAPLQLELPQELAAIEKIYTAPPGANPRLIFHIQDAHAHSEAQTSIKKLLDFLRTRYGLTDFFLEGAGEDLDPKHLQIFTKKDLNVRLADLLTQRGELAGAEAYLVEKDKGIRGRGVEEARLYRANYSSLKKVFHASKEVDRFLVQYEGRLDRLESSLFSSTTRRVLREWRSFQEGHREFLPYVKNLSNEAKDILNLDLGSLMSQLEWPQLTRLLVLEGMEKRLDLKAAQEEKARLLKFLRDQKVSSPLTRAIEELSFENTNAGKTPSQTPPRRLLEKLAELAGPKGFKFHEYPAFSLAAGRRILLSELNHKELFEEIELLFDKIFLELAKTPRERTLLELLKDTALLRQLLHLELSRKDWARVLDRKTLLSIDAMLSRLGDLEETEKRRNGETEKIPDSTIFRSALRFYELAVRREKVMFEKIDQAMRGNVGADPRVRPSRGDPSGPTHGSAPTARALQSAILITGGFHTGGLDELFEQNQISYVTLTPRMTQVSKEASHLYRDSMLQSRKTLFDLATLAGVAQLQPAEVRQAQGQDLPRNFASLLSAVAEVANVGNLRQLLKHPDVDRSKIIDWTSLARVSPAPARSEARVLTLPQPGDLTGKLERLAQISRHQSEKELRKELKRLQSKADRQTPEITREVLMELMAGGQPLIQTGPADLSKVNTAWGEIDLTSLNDVKKYEGRYAMVEMARDLELAHWLGLIHISHMSRGISPISLSKNLKGKIEMSDEIGRVNVSWKVGMELLLDTKELEKGVWESKDKKVRLEYREMDGAPEFKMNGAIVTDPDDAQVIFLLAHPDAVHFGSAFSLLPGDLKNRVGKKGKFQWSYLDKSRSDYHRSELRLAAAAEIANVSSFSQLQKHPEFDRNSPAARMFHSDPPAPPKSEAREKFKPQKKSSGSKVRAVPNVKPASSNVVWSNRKNRKAPHPGKELGEHLGIELPGEDARSEARSAPQNVAHPPGSVAETQRSVRSGQARGVLHTRRSHLNGNSSHRSSYNTNNLFLKTEEEDFARRRSWIEFFKASKFWDGILRKMIPGWSFSMTAREKSESWLMRIRPLSMAISSTFPFVMPLGERIASWRSEARKGIKPWWTFSSSRNFMGLFQEGGLKFPFFQNPGGIMKSGLDMLGSQFGIGLTYVFESGAVFDHLNHKIKHDTGSLEAGFPVADVGPHPDIFVDQIGTRAIRFLRKLFDEALIFILFPTSYFIFVGMFLLHRTLSPAGFNSFPWEVSYSGIVPQAEPSVKQPSSRSEAPSARAELRTPRVSPARARSEARALNVNEERMKKIRQGERVDGIPPHEILDLIHTIERQQPDAHLADYDYLFTMPFDSLGGTGSRERIRVRSPLDVEETTMGEEEIFLRQMSTMLPSASTLIQRKEAGGIVGMIRKDFDLELAKGFLSSIVNSPLSNMFTWPHFAVTWNQERNTYRIENCEPSESPVASPKPQDLKVIALAPFVYFVQGQGGFRVQNQTLNYLTVLWENRSLLPEALQKQILPPSNTQENPHLIFIGEAILTQKDVRNPISVLLRASFISASNRLEIEDRRKLLGHLALKEKILDVLAREGLFDNVLEEGFDFQSLARAVSQSLSKAIGSAPSLQDLPRLYQQIEGPWTESFNALRQAVLPYFPRSEARGKKKKNKDRVQKPPAVAAVPAAAPHVAPQSFFSKLKPWFYAALLGVLVLGGTVWYLLFSSSNEPPELTKPVPVPAGPTNQPPAAAPVKISEERKLKAMQKLGAYYKGYDRALLIDNPGLLPSPKVTQKKWESYDLALVAGPHQSLQGVLEIFKKFQEIFTDPENWILYAEGLEIARKSLGSDLQVDLMVLAADELGIPILNTIPRVGREVIRQTAARLNIPESEAFIYGAYAMYLRGLGSYLVMLKNVKAPDADAKAPILAFSGMTNDLNNMGWEAQEIARFVRKIRDMDLFLEGDSFMDAYKKFEKTSLAVRNEIAKTDLAKQLKDIQERQQLQNLSPRTKILAHAGLAHSPIFDEPEFDEKFFGESTAEGGRKILEGLKGAIDFAMKAGSSEKGKPSSPLLRSDLRMASTFLKRGLLTSQQHQKYLAYLQSRSEARRPELLEGRAAGTRPLARAEARLGPAAPSTASALPWSAKSEARGDKAGGRKLGNYFSISRIPFLNWNEILKWLSTFRPNSPSTQLFGGRLIQAASMLWSSNPSSLTLGILTIGRRTLLERKGIIFRRENRVGVFDHQTSSLDLHGSLIDNFLLRAMSEETTRKGREGLGIGRVNADQEPLGTSTEPVTNRRDRFDFLSSSDSHKPEGTTIPLTGQETVQKTSRSEARGEVSQVSDEALPYIREGFSEEEAQMIVRAMHRADQIYPHKKIKEKIKWIRPWTFVNSLNVAIALMASPLAEFNIIIGSGLNLNGRKILLKNNRASSSDFLFAAEQVIGYGLFRNVKKIQSAYATLRALEEKRSFRDLEQAWRATLLDELVSFAWNEDPAHTVSLNLLNKYMQVTMKFLCMKNSNPFVWGFGEILGIRPWFHMYGKVLGIVLYWLHGGNFELVFKSLDLMDQGKSFEEAIVRLYSNVKPIRERLLENMRKVYQDLPAEKRIEALGKALGIERSGLRSEARGIQAWEGRNVQIYDTYSIPLESGKVQGTVEVFRLGNAEAIARGLGLTGLGGVDAVLAAYRTAEGRYEPLYFQIATGAADSRRAQAYYPFDDYDEALLNPVLEHFWGGNYPNKLAAFRQVRMSIEGMDQTDQVREGDRLARELLDQPEPAVGRIRLSTMDAVTAGWLSFFEISGLNSNQRLETGQTTLAFRLEPDVQEQEQGNDVDAEELSIERIETYDTALEPFSGENRRNRYRAVYLSGSDAQEMAQYFKLGAQGDEEAVLVFWENEAGKPIPLFFQISAGPAAEQATLAFIIISREAARKRGKEFFDGGALGEFADKVNAAKQTSSSFIKHVIHDFNRNRDTKEGRITPRNLSARSFRKAGYLLYIEPEIPLEDYGYGRLTTGNLLNLELFMYASRSEAREAGGGVSGYRSIGKQQNRDIGGTGEQAAGKESLRISETGGASAVDNHQTARLFLRLIWSSTPTLLRTYVYYSFLLIQRPSNREIINTKAKRSLAGIVNAVKKLLAKAEARIIEKTLSITRWIKSRLAEVRKESSDFIEDSLRNIYNKVNKLFIYSQYLNARSEARRPELLEGRAAGTRPLARAEARMSQRRAVSRQSKVALRGDRILRKVLNIPERNNVGPWIRQMLKKDFERIREASIEVGLMEQDYERGKARSGEVDKFFSEAHFDNDEKKEFLRYVSLRLEIAMGQEVERLEKRDAISSNRRLKSRRSEMRNEIDETRGVLIDLARPHAGWLSEVPEEERVKAFAADAYLFFGNPNLRTFLKFAESWNRGKYKRARIFLAGGHGRGTPGLIARTLEHYLKETVDKKLTAEEERDLREWLEESKKKMEVTRRNGIETKVLRLILQKEGVFKSEEEAVDIIAIEEGRSTTTAGNFENTFRLMSEYFEKNGISNPNIALVSNPPLLRRLQPTATGIWTVKGKPEWNPVRLNTFDFKLEDLTDAELIEFLGYLVGYPEEYAQRFAAETESRSAFPLNRGNELKGYRDRGKTDAPEQTPEVVKDVKDAFKAFLDALDSKYGLVFNPDYNRLEPASPPGLSARRAGGRSEARPNLADSGTALAPWTSTSKFSSRRSSPLWSSTTALIWNSIDSRMVPTSVVVYWSFLLLALSFFISDLQFHGIWIQGAGIIALGAILVNFLVRIGKASNDGDLFLTEKLNGRGVSDGTARSQSSFQGLPKGLERTQARTFYFSSFRKGQSAKVIPEKRKVNHYIISEKYNLQLGFKLEQLERVDEAEPVIRVVYVAGKFIEVGLSQTREGEALLEEISKYNREETPEWITEFQEKVPMPKEAGWVMDLRNRLPSAKEFMVQRPVFLNPNFGKTILVTAAPGQQMDDLQQQAERLLKREWRKARALGVDITDRLHIRIVPSTVNLNKAVAEASSSIRAKMNQIVKVTGGHLRPDRFFVVTGEEALVGKLNVSTLPAAIVSHQHYLNRKHLAALHFATADFSSKLALLRDPDSMIVRDGERYWIDSGRLHSWADRYWPAIQASLRVRSAA